MTAKCPLFNNSLSLDRVRCQCACWITPYLSSCIYALVSSIFKVDIYSLFLWPTYRVFTGRPCYAATWHFRWKIKCDWPWTKLPYCHVCACAPWVYCSFLHASLLNPKLWSTKKRAANQSNPSWWQSTRSLRTNNQQIRKLVIHLHWKLNSISTGACPRRRMDWWERPHTSSSAEFHQEHHQCAVNNRTNNSVCVFCGLQLGSSGLQP